MAKTPTTRRALGTLCALALSIRVALAAEPAALNLVAFDRATPIARAEVVVDGRVVGRTNADGALLLRLEPGSRELVLRVDGREVLRQSLELAPGENAELIATLEPEAEPRILFESSRGSAAGSAPAPVDAGPPGRLAGRITSAEDGKPVANARVFVSGTPIDVRTDADGRFEATLPPGDYSISVVAPTFAARTLDGIVIASEARTERDVELTPSGLELPEFVVLEPFVEGSLAAFVEERRQSFAVADVLSIEQISRAGDSDVAGALRRVTGLTLVDGKYVYVRGLGERYSSILLNGASVPSPDPTRRVVALDLFPVEILEGVVIQKSFSPEMPGEFGGGTIQLRTKGIPDGFFVKLALSQGWVEGTTFKEGLRYDGGSQDWTGFDQVRGLPDSVIEANRRFGRLLVETPFSPGLTPAELQAVGEDLAAGGFDTRLAKLPTDGSLTFAIGNSLTIGDDWRVGFTHSIRYSQGWDTLEDVRRKFAFSSPNEPLVPVLDVERRRTEREIDLSGFLALGVEYGEHHRLRATTTLVRQTADTTQIDEGVDISEALSRFFLLEWEENALLAQQFNGSHVFPTVSDLGIDWNYTRARATRDAPNTRSYRYDFIEGSDGIFQLSPRSDSNDITYGELVDDTKTASIDLKLPFSPADGHTITYLAGLGRLDRTREATVRRYSFFGGPPPGSPDDFLQRPPGQIFAPPNIRPGGFVIREVTRNSDAYTAAMDLKSAYFNFDWLWEDLMRVTLGGRDERLEQSVRTFNLTNTSIVDSESEIRTKDVLPSVGVTWFVNEDSQLRAIFAETVSRPDFREVSTSPFIDPTIDTISIGNPDLVPAAIKNYDLRYEYYFSPIESASVALFGKEFTNPIERIQSPATGDVVTYTNVPKASLYGIEFDVYKSLGFIGDWDFIERLPLSWVPWQDVYLNANYARIESKVTLTRETAGILTNLERPLQGQSPYVANLQLGWYPEDGDRELSLLYNVSGRRISEVGVFGIPDVFEEPAGQLDLVYATKLPGDFKLKLRARNLLDPKVEFTVGDEIRREFRRGRSVSVSIERTF
jgi:outer membrane receptor protein involved in Fe transport